MIWLLALETSTSDSLNSTFSGQVQIETECARQRKISLQRRCEVYFPFFLFSFLFLSSTILLLLSLFVRCTTLRPNDFTLVSGGFVWARETTYVYIVQLEHVDAIGTSEVISHSLPFSVSPGVVVSHFCGSVVSFSYERSIRKMCFVLTCMYRWESVRVYGESYFGFSILYYYTYICLSIVDTHNSRAHLHLEIRPTHNKIRFSVRAIGYFQNKTLQLLIEWFDKK